MGYTTTFEGRIGIDPPLNAEEVAYLKKFSGTRRMHRTKGPYFVDGSGMFGQGYDADVEAFNKPPPGQPGLWCQWVPTDDGTAIVWDEGEKFYEAALWMKYLIDHFIGSDPIAKMGGAGEFDFLAPHTLNGIINAQGENPPDTWNLIVRDNAVFRQEIFQTEGPEEPIETA